MLDKYEVLEYVDGIIDSLPKWFIFSFDPVVRCKVVLKLVKEKRHVSKLEVVLMLLIEKIEYFMYELTLL